MRAVDTNVLVRLLARDDARQAAVAEAFVAKGAWASHLVLAETSWVLSQIYELRPADIAQAIAMLLRHKSITLQDADTVAAALARFAGNPSLGFSDCLVVEIARKAGHLPVGTFDRALSKVEGVERLSA
jgi:predicted nucleic-acid-binding protein